MAPDDPLPEPRSRNGTPCLARRRGQGAFPRHWETARACCGRIMLRFTPWLRRAGKELDCEWRYPPRVGPWKHFVRWRHGRKVGLVRQCTQCGYTWPMPHRAGRSHPPEGIELTPHLQSAAHLIGQQVVEDATSDARARYELDFCARCGSGRFVEYPADAVPGIHGQPPTPRTRS